MRLKILLLFLLSYNLNCKVTQAELATELIRINVKEPVLVFKQVMLETGYLNSKLCTKYNNLFGMRKPRNWISQSSGTTSSGYLKYIHCTHSLRDFKTYQEKYVKTDYLRHLKRSGYSKTKNYYKLVKSIKIESEILAILENKLAKK